MCNWTTSAMWLCETISTFQDFYNLSTHRHDLSPIEGVSSCVGHHEVKFKVGMFGFILLLYVKIKCFKH